MFNKDITMLSEAYEQILAKTNEATRFPVSSEDFSSTPYSNTYEHDKKVLQLRRLSNGEISKINNQEQYIVTWKNPEKHNNLQEQPLKGESVHSFLDEIASIRKAFTK
jgi:hypothetical protein